MNKIIKVSELYSLDDVMERIHSMDEFASSSDLTFDFTGLQYIKTISAALFARELRLLMAKRTQKRLKTHFTGYSSDKSMALEYLSFIGFFDFIGLPNVGQKVRATTEVAGEFPYLAITKYNYLRFKTAAEYDPYRKEYDYISEEARKIAGLLKTKDARNTLFAYAICEVLRNAYEHSGSPDFYAMGQMGSDGSLELVIIDDGKGIWNTLKGKYPQLASEYDAIREAMKPGVSGADFTKNNKYNNSGFGLYVLSEFAKRYGCITIASGSALISETSKETRQERVSDDGTFVGIYLRAIPTNAKEIIEKIIVEGEKISINSEYPIRPSKQTWNF